MTVTSLLIFLIVGAVAGWLAGQIVKGHGFGLVGNIVVGIIGAFIAGWLLPQVGFPVIGGPIVGSIIYAMIGAIILLFVIGLFKRA
ncbi:MAG: GlsB/YeaQ/YmgE family stress response membrane protein [Dokdonella sp.]